MEIVDFWIIEKNFVSILTLATGRRANGIESLWVNKEEASAWLYKARKEQESLPKPYQIVYRLKKIKTSNLCGLRYFSGNHHLEAQILDQNDRMVFLQISCLKDDKRSTMKFYGKETLNFSWKKKDQNEWIIPGQLVETL